jgi:hypothetical protein
MIPPIVGEGGVHGVEEGGGVHGVEEKGGETNVEGAVPLGGDGRLVPEA